MKPENKVIKDIFSWDRIAEWSDTHKGVFGEEGLNILWTWEDLLIINKKYPKLLEHLGFSAKKIKEDLRFKEGKGK